MRVALLTIAALAFAALPTQAAATSTTAVSTTSAASDVATIRRVAHAVEGDPDLVVAGPGLGAEEGSVEAADPTLAKDAKIPSLIRATAAYKIAVKRAVPVTAALTTYQALVKTANVNPAITTETDGKTYQEIYDAYIALKAVSDEKLEAGADADAKKALADAKKATAAALALDKAIIEKYAMLLKAKAAADQAVSEIQKTITDVIEKNIDDTKYGYLAKADAEDATKVDKVFFGRSLVASKYAAIVAADAKLAAAEATLTQLRVANGPEIDAYYAAKEVSDASAKQPGIDQTTEERAQHTADLKLTAAALAKAPTNINKYVSTLKAYTTAITAFGKAADALDIAITAQEAIGEPGEPSEDQLKIASIKALNAAVYTWPAKIAAAAEAITAYFQKHSDAIEAYNDAKRIYLGSGSAEDEAIKNAVYARYQSQIDGFVNVIKAADAAKIGQQKAKDALSVALAKLA